MTKKESLTFTQKMAQKKAAALKEKSATTHPAAKPFLSGPLSLLFICILPFAYSLLFGIYRFLYDMQAETLEQNAETGLMTTLLVGSIILCALWAIRTIFMARKKALQNIPQQIPEDTPLPLANYLAKKQSFEQTLTFLSLLRGTHRKVLWGCAPLLGIALGFNTIAFLFAASDLFLVLIIPLFTWWMSSFIVMTVSLLIRVWIWFNELMLEEPPSATSTETASETEAENKPEEMPTEPYTDSITPLLQACMEGDFSALKSLLPSEQINQIYKGNGNTALHIAVWNNYPYLVELLLEQPNIDPQIKNAAGKTALDLAEEKNLTEIIDLLTFTTK